MERLRPHWFALPTATCAVAALWLATLMQRDLVLFNHSPSIPEGFYIRSDRNVEIGAIVTVRAGDVAPREAQARHYDGAGDRFIKRVAAVEGDRICADAERLYVDGVIRARRYVGAGQTPPLWSGCRTLQPGEVLLLGDSADSFDGRYWGPISARMIEGVWRPL